MKAHCCYQEKLVPEFNLETIKHYILFKKHILLVLMLDLNFYILIIKGIHIIASVLKHKHHNNQQ